MLATQTEGITDSLSITYQESVFTVQGRMHPDQGFSPDTVGMEKDVDFLSPSALV